MYLTLTSRRSEEGQTFVLSIFLDDMMSHILFSSLHKLDQKVEIHQAASCNQTRLEG